MRDDVIQIRQSILSHFLTGPAMLMGDGWRLSNLEEAAEKAGYNADMVAAVFPQGVEDALDAFIAMVDDDMKKALDDITPDDINKMRIRDRVSHAVAIRFAQMDENGYKPAFRAALSHWAMPGRQWQPAKLLWRGADIIWIWAGDTSRDYNRYTKRGLLSAVISSTSFIWINDHDFLCAQDNDDSQSNKIGHNINLNSKTMRFLDNRIENVMSFGKFTYKMTNFFKKTSKHNGKEAKE